MTKELIDKNFFVTTSRINNNREHPPGSFNTNK